MTPLVSAVVPTAGRHGLLIEAVRSALEQTVREIEVIVVVDGPDPVTVEALAAVGDKRLRVVELSERRGPGGARNAGVAAARGEWVAFLDDDDVWIADKLEEQLALARRSVHAQPVVACREWTSGDGRAEAWPRRLPDPGEHVGDYLLARRGLFWGEGSVHTSTSLVRRELLGRVPFREDLAKHEDWDWLVRAARAGAAVEFVPDPPLAIRRVDDGRTRASRSLDWRLGLTHLRECRADGLISRRAHAAFLLTVLSDEAAEQRDLRALWEIPWEALRRGRPRVLHLLVFAGNFALPRDLRAGLRRRLARG